MVLHAGEDSTRMCPKLKTCFKRTVDDDGREARGGGGGDDGGEARAKRQRGRRGGRKTGNQKDVARRASASRDPV